MFKTYLLISLALALTTNQLQATELSNIHKKNQLIVDIAQKQLELNQASQMLLEATRVETEKGPVYYLSRAAEFASLLSGTAGLVLTTRAAYIYFTAPETTLKAFKVIHTEPMVEKDRLKGPEPTGVRILTTVYEDGEYEVLRISKTGIPSRKTGKLKEGLPPPKPKSFADTWKSPDLIKWTSVTALSLVAISAIEYANHSHSEIELTQEQKVALLKSIEKLSAELATMRESLIALE
ncbi:MAG: hypothetical protein AB7F43_10030 [Bacteriovoracia bacterium]